MCILRIPFAVLISIIVGCTNIIPIAGPLIGGLVGAVILLLASPQKILVFAILILIIQQLDGHVIGPKILGDSIGMSTLWVLFAIVVGGSLFGIMGMILGVPVLACLYLLLRSIVNERLEKKQKKRELMALHDKKVDTVIFDLDGTLLDSLDDLADSMNVVLREFGMPERSMEEIREFVGNGAHKLVERSVPEGTDPQKLEEVYAEFQAYYKEHYIDRTAPYEGIMELVRYLSECRIKMAVVSNKPEPVVQMLVQTFFEGLIFVAVGDVDGRKKKPSAEPVVEALDRLGSSTRKAVYVGDSDVDILTAKNAGIACISVEWGFRSRRFLKENGASILVSSPDEIKKIAERRG